MSAPDEVIRDKFAFVVTEADYLSIYANRVVNDDAPIDKEDFRHLRQILAKISGHLDALEPELET